MSAMEQVETVHWNLADLLNGSGESGVDALLDEALARAEVFAERYRGALAELDGAGLWRR